MNSKKSLTKISDIEDKYQKRMKQKASLHLESIYPLITNKCKRMFIIPEFTSEYDKELEDKIIAHTCNDMYYYNLVMGIIDKMKDTELNEDTITYISTKHFDKFDDKMTFLNAPFSKIPGVAFWDNMKLLIITNPSDNKTSKKFKMQKEAIDTCIERDIPIILIHANIRNDTFAISQKVEEDGSISSWVPNLIDGLSVVNLDQTLTLYT